MATLTPQQKAVALLAAAYPVPAWLPETLRLYASEIGQFSGLVVREAVMDWCRTQPQRPSLAELLKHCGRTRLRLRTEYRRAQRAAIEAQQSAALPAPDDELVDIGGLLRATRERIAGRALDMPPAGMRKGRRHG